MGSPAIDWNTTVPLYDQQGTLHAVPQAHAQDALTNGGASRAIPMIDPQGQHHWVHENEVQDAVGAGGRISFPSNDIPKWFGFTPGNVASNIWQGAKGMVGGAASLAKDLANNPNWFEGSGSTYNKFVGQPAEQQVVQAGQALQAGHRMEAAGHALASAVPMIGSWAASLGQQAGTGDIGGAAGQAIGTAAPGAALSIGPSVLNKVVPSTTRAGAGIGILKDRLGPEAPTGPLGSYKTASALIDKWDRTGTPIPSQLRAYYENVTGASSSGQPITFNDLWEHREALNDLKYDRNMPGKTARQVGQVAKQIGDEMQGIANRAGVGKDWTAQQAEYAKGKAIIRGADKLGPYIGALGGYEAGRLLGAPMGAEFGMGALGRYAGRPIVGGLTRSIIERNAGAPQLSGVPAPPGTAPIAPVIAVSPEAAAVPRPAKPFEEYTPAEKAAVEAANIARAKTVNPEFGAESGTATDTEAHQSALERDEKAPPQHWRRASDQAGAAPRPPAIWEAEERRARLAQPGQLIEQTDPATGERVYGDAPLPVRPRLKVPTP